LSSSYFFAQPTQGPGLSPLILEFLFFTLHARARCAKFKLYYTLMFT
jgi:hypothetical protein